jgi:hypothetical protein
MRWLFGLLLLVALIAQADDRVVICFNYGCLSQMEVVYSNAQMDALAIILGQAGDAAQERTAVGQVIGLMLAWAGEQSPIAADRGGNTADNGVDGRMDCIDHSTTTTRLLKLIESRGWLRYHRVLDIVQRKRFLLFDHFSAQIVEVDDEANDDVAKTRTHYAVDSWFFDNGHPAAVMPLERWKAGESPDVSE